jgi:transketolase
MGMRLIPNLTVIRPADPDETIEAWRIAASSRSRPTALALTRQVVPPLSTVGGDNVAAGNVSKGAYILRDRTGDPEILLIGTGSEVQLALSAAMILEQEAWKVRVVSMPSWELFADQSKEYQESVIPPLVRARVSVEAGTPLGWERHIGLDGEIIGLDRFGASAPGSTLMKNLGFTAENVAEASRRVLRANQAKGLFDPHKLCCVDTFCANGEPWR